MLLTRQEHRYGHPTPSPLPRPNCQSSQTLGSSRHDSEHRTKLHSTNPLERPGKEVKRRADVVGIFPDEKSIMRLIGAVLMEQNDDWQLQHRYMQLEAMAELLQPTAQDDPLRLPPKAA